MARRGHGRAAAGPHLPVAHRRGRRRARPRQRGGPDRRAAPRVSTCSPAGPTSTGGGSRSSGTTTAACTACCSPPPTGSGSSAAVAMNVDATFSNWFARFFLASAATRRSRTRRCSNPSTRSGSSTSAARAGAVPVRRARLLRARLDPARAGLAGRRRPRTTVSTPAPGTSWTTPPAPTGRRGSPQRLGLTPEPPASAALADDPVGRLLGLLDRDREPDADRAAVSSVAIAVFTPTTSPRALTSGPPELPGLIDASVCTASCRRPLPSRTSRSSALTMPAVTVPDRPNGEPTASTGSPTRVVPGCASASGRRPVDGRHPQHGDVAARVATDHLGRDPRPSGSDHDDRRRVADAQHVVVGDDVLVVVDREAGAGRRVAAVRRDLHRHHARRARPPPRRPGRTARPPRRARASRTATGTAPPAVVAAGDDAAGETAGDRGDRHDDGADQRRTAPAGRQPAPPARPHRRRGRRPRTGRDPARRTTARAVRRGRLVWSWRAPHVRSSRQPGEPEHRRRARRPAPRSARCR